MKADSRDEPELASPFFFSVANDHDSVGVDTEKTLEVLVVYTDTPGTLAALRMAEALAQRLAARIRLIFPYEVPYALPLTRPPVAIEFLQHQIRDLACKISMDVAAEIYLCRDKGRALKVLLKPHSLVIVGGERRWWRTATEKLARAVHNDGHDLLFAESR